MPDIRLVQPRQTDFPFSYGLLLVFLLLLYANPALLYPALEALRPTQVVAAAAIFMLFVEKALSRQGFRMVWPESYLLLAFLGAAGVSCVTALWMRQAVESWGNLAKMGAAYFLILNVARSERHLRGLIWAMVLGGLVPALGALHRYWNGEVIAGRAGWAGTFGNPNDLAFSLVILIPLAAFLSGESGPLKKALLGGILAIYGYTIYVTFSRGGMVGLLAVLGVLTFRHPARSIRFVAVALLAASLIGLVYFWSRPEGFRGLSDDASFQQRIETIRTGLEMFADRPLLGVGLGCSIVAWPLYAPPGILFQGALVNHNTFIQALSETGILGFLPFALLLGVALYHARGLARSGCARENGRTARMGAALEAALWGFVACGLSGGYVVSWFPYLLLGLIGSATLLANPFLLREQEPPSSG